MKALASTFRLACNQANRDNTGDLLRGQGQLVRIWKASLARIQCGVFVADPKVAGNLVDDWSNITAAVCVLRAGGPDGDLLCEERTIPVADINTALTFEQWTAGTASDAQHFTFVFSPEETNVAVQKTVWLCVGLLTTDAGIVPVAINNAVEIANSGLGAPGDVANAGPYTGYSKAETLALIGAAPAVDLTLTGTADLMALPTAAIPRPTVTDAPLASRTFWNVATATLESWLLFVGTDATSSAKKRPTDYASPGNTVVWVLC